MAAGGYRVLAESLHRKAHPRRADQDRRDSGLRGLWRRGFPTGRKWRWSAPRKGAVDGVNADEGDPHIQDRYYLALDHTASSKGKWPDRRWVVEAADV